MTGPAPDRRALLGISGFALVAGGLSAPAAAARQPENTDPMRVFAMPPQAPQREGMVEVDGGELYCWDTGGNDPPIILLHPLSGSGHIWGHQQPVFARAGAGVIGYSRRGYRADLPSHHHIERVGGGARSRPLRLLGAAGPVQRGGARLHQPESLSLIHVPPARLAAAAFAARDAKRTTSHIARPSVSAVSTISWTRK